MDNYGLMLIKTDGKPRNITKIIKDLSWEDDIETLGTKLSFNSARNINDSNMAGYDVIESGDKVILYNGSMEIFRGIVTNIDWGRYEKGITCFDYAFYLNQSKTVKQFKGIAASKAIAELCNRFSVPIGSIDTISTSITMIYKDKTVADIIQDILYHVLLETGNKYRLEMRLGKLYVMKYQKINIKPIFRQTRNSIPVDILKAISDVTKNENIQEMRNSIAVVTTETVTEDDNDFTTDDNIEEVDTERVVSIAYTEDKVNIGKYGLLQEVLTINKQDKPLAKNAAQNKLKELNKVFKEVSLSLLGSDELRAGRILTIKNAMFNLNGEYLIKSSRHNVSNGIHKCTVTVKEA